MATLLLYLIIHAITYYPWKREEEVITLEILLNINGTHRVRPVSFSLFNLECPATLANRHKLQCPFARISRLTIVLLLNILTFISCP